MWEDFELGGRVPMLWNRRCVCAGLAKTHVVLCWLHHWIVLGAERTEVGGSVIGHGIVRKDIPIMARLAKARRWSKR